MRISYEWLGDFVDLEGVTPKEAAEVLTRLGVEIESMTVIDLSEIVIGKDDDALGPHLGEATHDRQVFLALARAIHHLAGSQGREKGGMARQDTEVALDTRGHHFFGLGAHEHPCRRCQLETH